MIIRIANDSVLCFMASEFGKAEEKLLKIVIDFYSIEELCGAKKSLLNAVDDLNWILNCLVYLHVELVNIML